MLARKRAVLSVLKDTKDTITFLSAAPPYCYEYHYVVTHDDTTYLPRGYINVIIINNASINSACMVTSS